MKMIDYEILEQKVITYDELKQIKKQLNSLEKLQNCPGRLAIVCYKIAEISIDDKTKALYYVRLSSHDYDEDFTFAIIKQLISL
jgi:16S rRNA C1402 N4-methylase RsmH